MQIDRAKKIRILFEGKNTPEIIKNSIKTFEKIFELPVSNTTPLFSSLLQERREESAEFLVRIRIINPFRKSSFSEKFVTPVEKNYEMKRIETGSAPAYGVPYDGFEFARFVKVNILGKDAFKQTLPVVITDQLLMTYDENDLRYHARYLILSAPSVISLGGLVEGPAKPRAYYFERSELSTSYQPEVADALIRKKYEGKFLTHEDPRMHLVVAGCMLQAIFYMALGEGFCEHQECRLHNFHFQEDLIRTHATEKRNLCEKHEALLKKLQRVIK